MKKIKGGLKKAGHVFNDRSQRLLRPFNCVHLKSSQVEKALIGDREFKTTMPENVVYAGVYIRYIKAKSRHLLSDLETMNLCNRILPPEIRKA
jgi:hypothetical protein